MGVSCEMKTICDYKNENFLNNPSRALPWWHQKQITMAENYIIYTSRILVIDPHAIEQFV